MKHLLVYVPGSKAPWSVPNTRSAVSDLLTHLDLPQDTPVSVTYFRTEAEAISFSIKEALKKSKTNNESNHRDTDNTDSVNTDGLSN